MSSENDIPFRVKKYVVNKFISLPKLLKKLGYEVRENGSMYCPWIIIVTGKQIGRAHV